jgi:hypothetical protein
MASIQFDQDLIKSVLHSGNVPPLKEIIDQQIELKSKMDERFDPVPTSWLVRYDTLEYLITKLSEYYKENNLPLNYSMYGN